MNYSDYPKISGIYKIYNKNNGKVYIGSAINLRRRAYEHFSALKRGKHYNVHLQRSFSIDSENFSFEVVELCDKQDLITKENKWITSFKSNLSEFGYNMEGAGPTWFGKKHSEASKVKIRAARANQIISPESRKQALKSLLDRNPNHFKEAAQKSKLTKRKPRIDKSPWQTQDFREKISQISKSRIEIKSKPFVCNETKQIFKTTKEAAITLGISSYKLVWRVLKGQRNSVKGFSFSYLDLKKN